MQVFANVGTSPEWKESKSGGKGCWQSRIGEPFKPHNGVAQESTWYYLKDFAPQNQMPAYQKGDFIKVLGVLKTASYPSTKTANGTTFSHYIHMMSVEVVRKAGDKKVPDATLAAEADSASAAPVAAAPVAPAAARELELVAMVAEPVAPALAPAPSVEAPTGSKLVAAVRGVFKRTAPETVPDWNLA